MNKYAITNNGITVNKATEIQVMDTNQELDYIYFAKQIDGGDGTEDCWCVYSCSNADPLFLGWFSKEEAQFESDNWNDIADWYGEEMADKIHDAITKFCKQ